MSEKKVYSLSQLAQSIQNVISTHSSRIIWLKAEIVKLNYYPKSGHCYPTLVEKKNGKVIAELRGNIWGAHFDQINQKFRTVLKEELRDDMTVVIQGSVTFHPVHGLALNIVDIDPEYTLGELAREKAETISRLKEAQIFTSNKKTFLPTLPKTIAIISVETSKGYGDFMDVINRNPFGYKFHFLLFPAILQGEKAVTTIGEQLEKIRIYADVFDAVAVIRGGGAEIGLSCFDSFVLAEKIATFPIPVLTGIGHSTNVTVCELVSYESFITPTKIAEFLLQQFNDFAAPLREGEQKIQREIGGMFKEQKNNLKETARLFSSLTTNALNASEAELDNLLLQLENFSKLMISQERNELVQVKRAILSNALKKAEEEQKILGFTGEKITMLSPLDILKRGFSITRQNGKVILNASEIDPKQHLETRLYSGIVTSRIENNLKNSNNE